MKRNPVINKFLTSAILFFSCTVIILAVSAIFSYLGYSDPINDVVTGINGNSGNKALNRFLPFYFILDYAFISFWFIGWCGVRSHFVSRWKFPGILVFTTGFLGPLSDALETSLSVYLIYHTGSSVTDNSVIYSLWLQIREFSYVFPALTALFYAFLIFIPAKTELTASVISGSGVLLWLLSRVIPDLWFVVYIWWPVWFLFMGLVYLKRYRQPLAGAL